MGGGIINNNIFNKLLEVAARYGMTKIMAEDINGTITYRKAIISSYILSNRLAGVTKDEKIVGVLLPNSIGHVLTLCSLFYLNKTPSILNFTTGSQNTIDCADLSGIKSIITSRFFIKKAQLEAYVEELSAKFRIIYLEDVKKSISLADKAQGLIKFFKKEQAKAGDNTIILFTSGSESKPKGVVLSHAAIIANIIQIGAVVDYTSKDIMLNPLPMFHAFGLTIGTLLPILEGMQTFLYPSPLHYKVIPEICAKKKVSILLGTPTFSVGYAKHGSKSDFASLKFMVVGGEKLKAEVINIWRDKFGLKVLEGYGTTETAPILSINDPKYYKEGTIGKLVSGIDYKIEPVEGIKNGGKLLVKGPNVMDGYLLYNKGFVKTPEWYDTGDVVDVDSEGYLILKARLKRFAKIAGEMISLDAVEQMAESCFATDKNAAINISEGKKGEQIILYTTCEYAAKQLFKEYLSKTRHSMLNMPASIVIVKELPVLGSGKVDYITLRALAANNFKDQVV